MAFLTVRLVVTAAVKSANQNIAGNIKKFMLTSLDQQIGPVARFSALASSPKYDAPQNQILSATLRSNQHVNMVVPNRDLTVQEISRSLQIYSKERRDVEKDPKTLQLKSGFEKPTVLIFAWLNAKHKHLVKYANLYTDQGFEVVVTQLTPWQLLWPVKGSQLVAADIVKFLKNNEFRNGVIFHGFSVGGYLWGECMVHIARDLQNYQIVLDRVRGQIWDSAADITEIPEGVPRALFPRNPTLRAALRKYMIYHMKAFHEPATSHYIRSSQMFHTNMLRCPALFLVSKTDPVGTVEANTRVKDSWESNGVKCTFKCWDRSPHVGHFRKHTEEYTEILFSHIRQLDMGGHKQALRAKL
ncbi:transmembrane protein 53-A-like isoform X1 [Topomyia yanbarensis]|uniref:transmembrane protein 53-A-like isoform X1 n=2 Tax=Topomyia yanbarensis TaxID=2498891 RepID=UPI00273AF07C|nr:transmembrane protein 53-A-like isoform X1 [Topomyia yanbarensis]XP_058829418.1 transmembrane protein 53-A-like isoform X1 [Topomyia yanbarensis]XP_058829419.1 transmembrane protein 53-A-like isoform X1 [Topomyia yanbarensis]